VFHGIHPMNHEIEIVNMVFIPDLNRCDHAS
jgi:hypothetical protein